MPSLGGIVGTPSNIRMGPANLWVGVTPPASGSPLSLVSGAPVDGINIGLTMGPVEVSLHGQQAEFLVQQALSPVAHASLREVASLAFECGETTALLLRRFLPGASARGANLAASWIHGGGLVAGGSGGDLYYQMVKGAEGYWRLNNPVGAGTVLNAGTGGTITGTVQGLTIFGQPGRADDVTAADFPYSSEVVMGWIGFADNALFHRANGFTVEFWYKTNSISGSGQIIVARWENPPNQSWIIGRSTDRFVITTSVDGTAEVSAVMTSDNFLKVGRWTHCAFVFRAGPVCDVYVNGRLVRTLTLASAIYAAAVAGLSFGGWTENNGSMDGSLQDVTFWDSELTAADVMNHYMAGASPRLQAVVAIQPRRTIPGNYVYALLYQTMVADAVAFQVSRTKPLSWRMRLAGVADISRPVADHLYQFHPNVTSA